MSYLDVGKDAKRAGIEKPSVRRKLDPVPPPAKPPGKAKARSKTRKVFGYTFQRRAKVGDEVKRWHTITHYTWYATEKQRNDAMRAAGGYYRGAYYEIRNVKPITRGGDTSTPESR